jgi:hypothetical protein
VAFAVTGQQTGDGILPPDPVGRAVGQADPVALLIGIGINDVMATLAEQLQGSRLAGPGHPGNQYLGHIPKL